MAWRNPVSDGVWTRGFAPSTFWADAPMYADSAVRKAHDIGNGIFTGATYWAHFHAALDIAAPAGTPIYAPEAGEVLDAKWGVAGTWANGGGWFVRVLVNDTCMYLLAHCSQLLVRQGQYVRKGQLIARVGATGVATGNHTHFWARLGPRPYYDPAAFYWNPALILPGGPLSGDPRFAPDYTELPDTGIPALRHIDGDPAPMRFRSEVLNGRTIARTVLPGKPIRSGVSVNSDTLISFGRRKSLDFIGRIPKEKLPAGERQYGDVLIAPVYLGNGHALGYVKQVDLAGN